MQGFTPIPVNQKAAQGEEASGGRDNQRQRAAAKKVGRNV